MLHVNNLCCKYKFSFRYELTLGLYFLAYPCEAILNMFLHIHFDNELSFSILRNLNAIFYFF